MNAAARIEVREADGTPMTAERCIEVADKVSAEAKACTDPRWRRRMQKTARDWREIAARLMVQAR